MPEYQQGLTSAEDIAQLDPEQQSRTPALHLELHFHFLGEAGRTGSENDGEKD